jgi:FdhD protein
MSIKTSFLKNIFYKKQIPIRDILFNSKVSLLGNFRRIYYHKGMNHPTEKFVIRSYRGGKWREDSDILTLEEPLEIHVACNESEEVKLIATTMRTPGHDDELGIGFLYTEGLIRNYEQVRSAEQTAANEISICVDAKSFKTIMNSESLNRYSFVNASCGVCGRTSIEDLRVKGFRQVGSEASVAPSVLLELPNQMRSAQRIFHHTGGLHAAGLFDPKGEPVCVREDIGRHNAVDKVIGDAWLRELLPLNQHVLMVSGRLSYEIVQKVIAAQIPILAALSAPSHLAVKVAHEFGVTLIGFLRDDRFNVYTHPERVN